MGAPVVFLVPYYLAYCPEVQRPYCLNYTNTSGELAVTRFTYNRRGRNDKAFYQQITGHRSSHNFHEFDKAGRMFRKYRKYNDGETSEEHFLYDDQDRLIQERFTSSNGDKGMTRYEYDDDGNAVHMICEEHKGWLEATLHYDFDKAGKRLAGRIVKNGLAAGNIRYKYDNPGNLIQEHWDIDNGGWSQTLNFVYEPASAT